MSNLIYLSPAEVVELHILVEESTSGTVSPLLRLDSLESAVNRPRQLATYEPGADLISQATTLAFGISQAQAFQDGNKRTAFAAVDVFLLTNGYMFTGDSIAFANWLVCLAGKISQLDQDGVIDCFGLDMAVELDELPQKQVYTRFERWLRINVSPAGSADDAVD